MTDDRRDPSPTAVDEAGREPLLLDDGSEEGPGWLRSLLGAVLLLGGVGVVVLLLDGPDRAPLLPSLVTDRLGASGVSNPVTAVLMNFRAWDTLLEVTVLVAAVVVVWSLDRDTAPLARSVEGHLEDPVLHELVRVVVPLAATVAVYLTWVGSHAAGGAFQAGALMAGAAVLLAAGGYIPPFTAAYRTVRVAVAAGIVVFLGVGAGSMVRTGSFLAYPADWAHTLILTVESAMALSIAVALTQLFVDVPSITAADPSLERVDPTGDPLGRVLARTRPTTSGSEPDEGPR
ncbi:MAG TPA: hydrogen gas-evolving membrane-bound hydrogenase subunit E [Longimicrobiales bacterium]|nr:hydrogen gas-evolving membrane-bound hydrogenase subunit E [Longimicrobiales bacterium]